MTPVRVRCVGHPGTTPPCSWTGTYALIDGVAEGHCPVCDGLLQAVADPAPDLQQAIHAAKRLREEANAYRTVGPNSPHAPEFRLKAAAYELGADALVQLQAAQAEVEQLREELETANGAYEGAQQAEVDARTLLVNIRTQLYNFFTDTALEHHAALGQVDQ